MLRMLGRLLRCAAKLMVWAGLVALIVGGISLLVEKNENRYLVDRELEE